MKAYVDKLMKEENVGYYLSLGKLGESNYEKAQVQDVGSYFGMTISSMKSITLNKHQKRMHRLSYIDIAYETFLADNKTMTNNFDTAIENFKT